MFVVGALASVGCAAPFVLEIKNVQGPNVIIVVNGAEAGHLECRAQPLVLVEGINAPKLPWQINLMRRDGTTFRSVEIDRSKGPRLLIFETGVVEVPLDPATVAVFEQMQCPPA